MDFLEFMSRQARQATFMNEAFDTMTAVYVRIQLKEPEQRTEPEKRFALIWESVSMFASYRVNGGEEALGPRDPMKDQDYIAALRQRAVSYWHDVQEDLTDGTYPAETAAAWEEHSAQVESLIKEINADVV